MTPEPPASSDGSPLPARHRPTLGNLAKDTTEVDLWAFEDDLELPAESVETESAEAPKPPGREIPAPRERQPGKAAETENRPASKPPAGEEQIRMNVTKSRSKIRPAGPVPGPAKTESDFDDLEHWEDSDLAPEIEDLPGDEPSETIKLPIPTEPIGEEVKTGEPEPIAVSQPAAGANAVVDEFSPVMRDNAVPISLRPHLSLSKVERVGLIVLLVVLLGGGSVIFLSSLHRLPVESAKAESNDFPIKGDHLTITSAKSYWRAPITEGPETDTFRRGTELLPVLEIAATGGPATLRVFFRDDEGRTIGDAITRTLNSGGLLKIPATAGFDDPGMHAAYRTGESKPWTIEVREILPGDSSDGTSRKLFEMNISTDRH